MQIYQVKGRLVNSYVVEDGQHLFVVDVAVEGEKYVLGFIEQVLHRPIKDVTLVLSTHDDPDHIGGVRRLAKQCGAEVGYPLASLDPMTKMAHDPMGMVFRFGSGCMEMMRGRAWDMYVSPKRNALAQQKPMKKLDEDVAVAEDEKYTEPDYRLKDGNTLPGFPDWQVVHTPGHTWDSCCYYHTPSKSLLTGDTLLGSKKKGNVVMPSIYSNPFQLSQTIERLKTLNPCFIYPGHGSHFEGSDLLGHL